MSNPYLPSPPVSPTPQRRSTTSNRSAFSHSPRTPSASSISLDPFAANAKATQAPPLYHQRHGRPRTPEPETRRSKPAVLQLQTPPAEVDLVPRKVTFQYEALSFGDPQKALWEDAIDSLFTGRAGEIDLQNKHLTYIPPIVSDAAKLVVLKPDRVGSHRSTGSFSRAVSAPVATTAASSSRVLDRTKTSMFGANSRPSAMDAAYPSKHAEIQLLLASNSITKLPNELFLLRGLTVLSLSESLDSGVHVVVQTNGEKLGSNQLTRIPPAISHLVNLEELNLSNNRISYLPSEIIGMNLKKLLMNANHLLRPPKAPGAGRVMSPLERHREGVRSLLDIATSILLSPALTSTTEVGMKTKTKLEEIWELPLPPGYPSPELSRKLDAGLPRACRSRSTDGPTSALRSSSPSPQPSGKQKGKSWDAEDDAGTNPRYNACPSPHHLSSTMFVDHAEERFEWVKEAAEVVVSDLPGGVVPIQWRGCSSACLDFLEGRAGEDVQVELNPAKGMVVEEAWEEEFELDA
ncbi:hypothetical protein FRB90_012670 [Tulasnella sp. 427]|nr:hypothetical protein FRB90_012670 [Tulasnella sp. 427]